MGPAFQQSYTDGDCFEHVCSITFGHYTSHSITAQHSIRFHHHPLMLFLDSFEAIGSDDIVEFEKWGPAFQQSYTDGDCFEHVCSIKFGHYIS